jgi:ABC-type Zn uptake system ZnuABC Zn-binding protein ZnuA
MILAAVVGSGCRDSGAPSGATANGAANTAASPAPIAVTSSYLETVIRDLLRRDVPFVRLAGPSMCPGHFDVRPGQISELASCGLLVRFDFQRSLDEKLVDRKGESLKTLPVALSGGLGVPETYLTACRQIADYFVSVDEMDRTAADDRLSKITGRMTTMTREIQQKIDATGMRGMPVVASGHQAAFCQWLGLQTVATFSGGDTASTGEIDRVVKAGEASHVRIVVANEPEGRRLADALADRFDARVVLFANFPEPGVETAFDNMVRRNLAALLDTRSSAEDKR